MSECTQELIEAGLAMSSADGCVVIGSESTATNLRWAANSLTTNGQMSSRSMTVISTVDGAQGTSAGVITRAVSTVDELTQAVRDSESAARAAAPADDAFALVEPYPHDDDWDAPAATTDADVFRDFAPALGATFDSSRRRDERLFGFAEHQLGSTWVGTSTGLRRRFDQPDGRLELNAKSADFARSAWLGLHTRDFVDVDVVAAVEELHVRLGWAKERIELPAGRYETILPPSAVADLMIYAYWTAAARDAEEGRSVFSRIGIGDSVSPLPVTLRSDPAAAGLECADFEIATASGGGLQSVFDNGAKVDPALWIRDGRLVELMRTRNWAARSGAAPRPAVGNLLLEAAGTASLADMIASTERGLLLTCLWYIREVDPQTLLMTGLTRDGVYLIEDGQVRGAVNNFRFNESPVDLLGRLTEIGRTEPTLPRELGDYFSRVAMPAVRVPDFNMSSVSEAS